MEQFIVYVVQFWPEGYGLWTDCAERRPEGLFAVLRVGFAEEAPAREKLSAMREAYPAGRYRLIRRTTTTEEI